MKKLLICLLYILFSTTQETAIVERIIDGDTIKVSYNGRLESLRLIGINAFEKNEPGGAEATMFLHTLLHKGNIIIVEFDKRKRDKYRRLLGYVYLGKEMLNEKLIKEGYASPFNVPPNNKYQRRFQEIFDRRK